MTKPCRAPDPNTKTPKFKLPPNATDAHCHIFGPADKYPYAEDRTYTPPDAGLDKFKALQKILGLTRAVIVNASCHGVNNAPIIDAIAQSGGAYRGVANIDKTFDEKAIADLDSKGIRGCRFNFVRHLGGVPDMDEFHLIVNRIKQFNWHVVVLLDAIYLVGHAQLLGGFQIPYSTDRIGRVAAKEVRAQQAFR